MNRLRRVNQLIILLSCLIGLLAFLYPFFNASLAQSPSRANAHTEDAPILMVGLVVLCLGSVLTTLGSGQMNSKTVAMLGVLTAANAVLRLVPGPAGFSAVFVLPILTGSVFGASFGFLLGALSILVSAFVGAGIGPWLPYQMFVTGWLGLCSGLLARIVRRRRFEIPILIVWAALWGFIFGALMNVWFWPYVFQAQQAEMYWQPGAAFIEAIKRYALFYVTTSAWWDLARAVGNALLIGLFGKPILKLLRRFQQRFFFEIESANSVSSDVGH
ncbi:MAG: ECF transporter S component [Chloroflexi bacterium]|nr:ECF transporter S component [Chloroflexota bacterium]